MTQLAYIDHEEFLVGANHPSAGDTLNRPVKDLLTKSGLDPAASFGGFGSKQSVVDQFAQDFGATVGLTYAYKGGTVAPNGVIALVAGGIIAMAPNSTNYVERDAAGAVFTNTVAFTPTRVPLAKVATDAVQITVVQDCRIFRVGRPSPRLNPRIDSTAIGDGIANDGPIIAAVDAAAANGGVEHHPGTYLFAATTTLAKSHRVHPGARFKPAAGQNIQFDGEIEAGRYQIFDFSLGGTVTFTKQRVFKPEWFGVTGDGVTDDAAALNAMTRSIPDYALVKFSSALNMIIKDEWTTYARRGIRYLAEHPTFPDGTGASLKWMGPGYIHGTDATITQNSFNVTTVLGLFTPAHVGKRFIIKGPGGNSKNINGKITAYNSATSVTLDTAADWGAAPGTTSGGLTYTVGGVMMSLISCDHCDVEGFAILFTNQNAAAQGYSGYINAGSQTFNVAGTLGRLGPHAGKMIRVRGAGAGGSDLITVIDAVASDAQGTLHDAAGTTISVNTLANFEIGPNSTSLPAIYGIMSDLTGINGCTGTNCYFEKNLFHTSGMNIPATLLSISTTTQSNQEYHRVLRNTLHGGDWGLQGVSPVSTTAASTTVVASVAVPNGGSVGSLYVGMRIRIAGAGQAVLADTSIGAGQIDLTSTGATGSRFMEWMIGNQITIPGAGVAGAPLVALITSILSADHARIDTVSSTAVAHVASTVKGATLDTKILSITDNTHFVIKDPAVSTVAGAFVTVGEYYSTCLEIGSSFNAKKISIRDNIFSTALVSVWQRNGSFEAQSNSHTQCETCYIIDGASEVSGIIQDNHEGCLRFIENKHGVLPINIKSCRFGSIGQAIDGGHIRFTDGREIIMEACGFDNLPPAGATVFEFNGDNRLILTGGNMFPAGITQAQLGLTETQALLGAQIIVEGGLINASGLPGEAIHMAIDGVTPALRRLAKYQTGGEGHCIDAFAQIRGDATKVSAIRADIGAIGGNPSNEAAGLDVGVGQRDGSFGSIDASAILVRLPTAASGVSSNAGKKLHGIHIAPPANLSGVTDMYGLRIEGIAATNLTNPHAIWQEGTSDLNLLGGLTTFGSGRIEKATVYIDIGAGGNATPNAAGAEEYRYRMAGAATVNNPLNLQKGMVFKLVMFNNTAGAITPALGAKFLGSGFGAIGANKSRSRMYMYDDVLDKLEPIGAVSEDF